MDSVWGMYEEVPAYKAIITVQRDFSIPGSIHQLKGNLIFISTDYCLYMALKNNTTSGLLYKFQVIKVHIPMFNNMQGKQMQSFF